MSASAGRIGSWLQFAIGACLFVMVAGGLDLAGVKVRTSLGAQTLSSLWFGFQLLVFACIAAVVLWLAMRAAKGKGAPDFRDSVLWSACLIGGMVMLIRMLG